MMKTLANQEGRCRHIFIIIFCGTYSKSKKFTGNFNFVPRHFSQYDVQKNPTRPLKSTYEIGFSTTSVILSCAMVLLNSKNILSNYALKHKKTSIIPSMKWMGKKLLQLQ